ncbi:MAG: DegT/DnrJ/EryC1/StrS family aminotransferase [Candidatus Heimdallarchaeota archaeon]
MQIPLFKIYSDENDIASVTEIIRSGMYWAIGPLVSELEKRINEYLGSHYCVVFNSGTSALHALMLAYNLGNGDEIIVPSFTFIATANSALFVHAKPIFADIESQTFGLDPGDVLERISKKTKAIIPVHYGGCPAQISALRDIANDHNILLIEDAAESFGSTYHGKMTGTFGDSAMLSFCQNKVITTGEGGGIVTDSKEIYEKLLLIRSHGRLDDKDYFSNAKAGDYVSLGYNTRLSNIQAALGVAQLAKVEKIILKRETVARYYIENLKEIPEIILPQVFPNTRNVFQLFSIRVKQGLRDKLIDFLKSKGISSKVYFSPVHLTHFYKDVLQHRVHLPKTELISNEILSLPIYPTMTEEEQNYVVDTVKTFFGS